MLSVKLPKAKYIIAVSGGVDSMVLLDILRRQPDVDLVVAHLNHGIRDDSNLDEELVHHYTMSHNIIFVSKHISLGKGASEEKARKARYSFLRQCRKRFNTKFIVTAQHQDDLVETAIINLLRGTSWRGLAPFTNTKDVLRPLINYKKSELITYAKRHNIPWREDSTNQDQMYLRNYVRRSLLSQVETKIPGFYDNILRLIRKQQVLRRTIQTELNKLLLIENKKPNELNRHLVIMLPPFLGYELIQHFVFCATGASLVRSLA